MARICDRLGTRDQCSPVSLRPPRPRTSSRKLLKAESHSPTALSRGSALTLTEADTRAKLIDPALREAGWEEDHIRREVKVTDGRLYLVGNEAHRRKPLWADYVLLWEGIPIAVVEAKDDSHHVAAGLQQAKSYSEMLDVRFAYSSNGKGFVEFDYHENTERQLAIDAFPTPDDLASRLWDQGALPSEGNPILYPYNTSMGLQPRYYQDVAVRRALQAIEDGQRSLLLALATGTGKTYIASQIAWKLYQTKRVQRVLFLVDRIFLRDQAFNDFSFFAGPGGDPRYAIEGELPQHSAIYFGMYQSLYGDGGGTPLFRGVPRDFFDLIVIDECHRSGFGTWREILDYFQDAVQLGLTATPKRKDNVDTYAYFGEPVYSYSLGQGIQDGFLATYKVHKVDTNLDEAGGVNVEDAVIAGADLFVPEGTEELKSFYSVAEFEQKISLPDWTERICQHLAATLSASDPTEKTIVFCVNMDHALDVRQYLQNHFAHLGYSDYAVRIVSEEPYATSLLEDFRDPYRETPVLATTVDLLSTGVDIPSVRNLVFIKPVGSAVVFKQAVGRGTRLDPITKKTWFRIIDYTNATRLFDDWDRPLGEPEELPPKPWNGIIRLQVIDSETTDRIASAWAIAVAAPNEQVQFSPEGNNLLAQELPPRFVSVHVGAPNHNARRVRLPATVETEAELAVVELRPVKEASDRIVLAGVEVEIATETILTVDATGQQMSVSEYLAYAKGALRQRVESTEDLRVTWLDGEHREQLLNELEHDGIHLSLIADLEGVHDADAHDVVNHVAFSGPLVRRAERADAFLNHNGYWLRELSKEKRNIAMELVAAYRDGGIDQLDRQILRLDRFAPFGGAVGVIKALGGSAALDILLGELRERLYPPIKEAA
jgi:type I restriction enzyme, R subunit